MSKKAVISCSGGLDSTCLLMKLLADKNEDGTAMYDEIFAYSFNYGQKHTIELKKMKKNVKFLNELGFNVHHQIIDVTDVFSDNTSSLVASTGKDIPEGDYREETMKSTVVPERNVIFGTIMFSKAINVGVKNDCNVDIALGIHGGDHTIYPDCRPESRDAVEHACRISDWESERVSYKAPFVNIPKSEVLREGVNAMKALGFKKSQITKVLRNTHSCYTPNEKNESCGKCGTCVERLEAFEAMGMKDPIKYVKE